MIMTIKWLIVFIILIFFTSVDSWAFRCGSGLVGSGNTKTQVLVTCGKPTSKEKSCENQRGYTNTAKKTKKCGNKVERWYYNCGDMDFIYVLTFENNILKNETTEGRGKGKSDCRGK
jgi:hypothetical protein